MSSKKMLYAGDRAAHNWCNMPSEEIDHEQKLIDSWPSCIELDKWNSDKIKIKISSQGIIANH
jgi:hypothetical protein